MFWYVCGSFSLHLRSTIPWSGRKGSREYHPWLVTERRGDGGQGLDPGC